MNDFLKLGIFLVSIILTISSAEPDVKQVAKAEVQSCSGCSLRKLSEVRSFIFDDVPLYERVVFKNIPSAPPELVLFTKEYKELKRIPLRDLTRAQCNELLQDLGFMKKVKTEL